MIPIPCFFFLSHKNIKKLSNKKHFFLTFYFILRVRYFQVNKEKRKQKWLYLKSLTFYYQKQKGRNLLIGILIACHILCRICGFGNRSLRLLPWSLLMRINMEVEATIAMNRENMMQNFDPENREDAKADMNEVFQTASSITAADIGGICGQRLWKAITIPWILKWTPFHWKKAEQSMEGHAAAEKEGIEEFEGNDKRRF